MLKKLAAIGLAASIGFTPIVLAPMTAMAQDAVSKPTKVKSKASKATPPKVAKAKAKATTPVAIAQPTAAPTQVPSQPSPQMAQMAAHQMAEQAAKQKLQTARQKWDQQYQLFATNPGIAAPIGPRP